LFSTVLAGVLVLQILYYLLVGNSFLGSNNLFSNVDGSCRGPFRFKVNLAFLD
jgi:hypothetical protein